MKLIMTPKNVNHWGYINTQTEIGNLYIAKFSANYPSGKPWHLIGMGWFAESPEALMKLLETRISNPDSPNSYGSYTGYGFNTHAPCGN